MAKQKKTRLVTLSKKTLRAMVELGIQAPVLVLEQGRPVRRAAKPVRQILKAFGIRL